MLSDAWAGRRVFLTGHTGFKGSWLTLLLDRLGAEVHGYALPPPAEGIFEAAGVSTRLASSVLADVRDAAAVRSALDAARPDVVIHMAAQPLVRLSYEDPVGTYATNVMGSVHVLEAVRLNAAIKACVLVTSDKCYENREWPWGYRENEPMGGHDPYSNSKGCAELVTSAYQHSYFSGDGVRVASARAGNVIGGGDWSRDRLLPDIMRSFRAGEAVSIRFPGAIRPWQHVLDPLVGYLKLAERLLQDDGAAYVGGWNFGPGESSERTVEDVVNAAVEAWGEGPVWTRDEAVQPHEAHFLKLDSSRARRSLEWTPCWNFSEAIARSVNWYRDEHSGAAMDAKSLAQIEDYLSFAGDIEA